MALGTWCLGLLGLGDTQEWSIALGFEMSPLRAGRGQEMVHLRPTKTLRLYLLALVRAERIFAKGQVRVRARARDKLHVWLSKVLRCVRLCQYCSWRPACLLQRSGVWHCSAQVAMCVPGRKARPAKQIDLSEGHVHLDLDWDCDMWSHCVSGSSGHTLPLSFYPCFLAQASFYSQLLKAPPDKADELILQPDVALPAPPPAKRQRTARRTSRLELEAEADDLATASPESDSGGGSGDGDGDGAGDVIEIEDDNSDGGGAGDGCPEEAAPAASTEAPPQPPAAEAGEAGMCCRAQAVFRGRHRGGKVVVLPPVPRAPPVCPPSSTRTPCTLVII